MHLFSGDRQMNTEMNYSRKLNLDLHCNLYVSERDMLWSISRVVIFKLDQNPIFLSHLAIPKFK